MKAYLHWILTAALSGCSPGTPNVRVGDASDRGPTGDQAPTDEPASTGDQTSTGDQAPTGDLAPMGAVFDQTVVYGEDPLQFALLNIPRADEPIPFAVVLHGGCWNSRIADLNFMNSFVEGLNAEGIATLNGEYRTVAEPNGGWPNTFLDIAQLVDHLPALIEEYPLLDGDRVTLVGHSAGGHLALWAGSRDRINSDSALYAFDPFMDFQVVGLGAIADLAAYRTTSCGSVIESGLIQATPEEAPERYRNAAPIELLPVGLSVVLFQGSLDSIVPSTQGEAYTSTGQQLGSDIELNTVHGAGHFDLIDPRHTFFGDLVDRIKQR